MVEITLDWVVAGYLVKDNKVLLVDHKKLDLILPAGGHRDFSLPESPDDTLRREIREELNGTEIKFLQYPKPRRGNNLQCALPFYTNVHDAKDRHFHYCLFYLCSPIGDVVGYNKNELNGIFWLSKEQLDNPRIPDSVKDTAEEALELAKQY